MALALGRLGIGAGIWLAPRAALRTLGFRDLDAVSLTMARIAASRDLVLGAWQLGSLSGRSGLLRASAAGAVADAGDTLAFALALGAGPTQRRAACRGLLGAAPAAIAGAWVAAKLARGAHGRPRSTRPFHPLIFAYVT